MLICRISDTEEYNTIEIFVWFKPNETENVKHKPVSVQTNE